MKLTSTRDWPLSFDLATDSPGTSCGAMPSASSMIEGGAAAIASEDFRLDLFRLLFIGDDREELVPPFLVLACLEGPGSAIQPMSALATYSATRTSELLLRIPNYTAGDATAACAERKALPRRLVGLPFRRRRPDRDPGFGKGWLEGDP